MSIPNIYFKIGQPSTGKSYGFRLEYLQKTVKGFESLTKDEYTVIPVSGGVGNEYKGLQNTDLAISYDVINQTIRFGEFLKTLMKAIRNPSKKFVVFLDDFHNQDISSLLSEYTPLFKAQQKVDLTDKVKDQEGLDIEKFEDARDFIVRWNAFIETLRDEHTTIVPITNRLSGEDILLVFPANFYLFGAANFNEKTVSIFADWADRAYIKYINPIHEMKNDVFEQKGDFVECVKAINRYLVDILEENEIFDYEKYCFGIWKIVDEKDAITQDEEKQKELIRFLFGMIKNALVYNNKNSHINEIGKSLLEKIQVNMYFSELFKDTLNGEITNKILHAFGIYES